MKFELGEEKRYCIYNINVYVRLSVVCVCVCVCVCISCVTQCCLCPFMCVCTTLSLTKNFLHSASAGLTNIVCLALGKQAPYECCAPGLQDFWQ